MDGRYKDRMEEDSQLLEAEYLQRDNGDDEEMTQVCKKRKGNKGGVRKTPFLKDQGGREQ